jgi:hypothetical protein
VRQDGDGGTWFASAPARLVPEDQRPRRPYFAGLEFAGRPREVSADSRKQRSTGTLMTLLVPEYFSLIRAAERR